MTLVSSFQFRVSSYESPKNDSSILTAADKPLLFTRFMIKDVRFMNLLIPDTAPVTLHSLRVQGTMRNLRRRHLGVFVFFKNGIQIVFSSFKFQVASYEFQVFVLKYIHKRLGETNRPYIKIQISKRKTTD